MASILKTLDSLFSSKATAYINTGYAVAVMIYVILVMVGWVDSTSTVISTLMLIGGVAVFIWNYKKLLSPYVGGGCACGGSPFLEGGCGCTEGGGITDAVKKVPEMVRQTKELLGTMDQLCEAAKDIPSAQQACERVKSQSEALRVVLNAVN